VPSVPIFSLNFQSKEYFDGEDDWFLVEKLMREFYIKLKHKISHAVFLATSMDT
jgi:hypothetical protein